MTDQQPEPTITSSQLAAMLGAIDVDKLRDADGTIDSTKLASTVAALIPGSAPAAPPRRGPTATGHNTGPASGAGGRDLFEQRHRRSKLDE